MIHRRVVKPADERRKELMDAARALFMEQGYEETAMSSIAKRAKVAQGTSYIYFRSKQELLMAIMQELLETLAEVFRRLAERTDLPAPVVLSRAMDDCLALVTREKHLIEAIYLKSNYAVPSRLLEDLAPKLLPLLTSIIERGVREGSMKVTHPRIAADFLWTVGYRMFELQAQQQMTGGQSDGSLSEQELQEAFREMVTQGLGVRVTKA
ncbi:MAG: TetR family transcriptional regulator [Mycobacterium leprae]